jgi:hypothetical protein
VSRELQGLKPLLPGLVMSPLQGRRTKITHKDKLQKRPTEMLGIRAWGPIVASIAMIPIGGGVELGGVPVTLQTKHTIDFTGQSTELAGLMAVGRRRE